MEKDQQQKYLELQMMDQQIKQIQKQLQMVDSQMIELVMTKQSLDELKDVKVNSQILAPIASGIFIKADIKDNDKLLVNIGSNTTVEKNREEVKGMIDKQIEEVKKVQQELLIQLQKTGMEAQNIEKELKNV